MAKGWSVSGVSACIPSPFTPTLYTQLYLMCCSHTCQFSVIAALPPPFPLLSFPFTPLPLSLLWIASLFILIGYSLPCLLYLLPPPILSYLFLPYLEEKCETLPC